MKLFRLTVILFCSLCAVSSAESSNLSLFLPAILRNHSHEKEGVKAWVGDPVETVQKTIGSDGGDIQITQGIASGVTVTFPPGSLDEENNVTLSRNEARLLPKDGVFSNIVIDITPEKEHVFYNPIQIKVPFEPNKGMPIPYYINARGYLEPCQIVDLDMDAGMMTFESYHASFFTWIFSVTTLPREDLTKFTTNHDGFRISNAGTPPLTTGGECLGMSAFSVWYYQKKGSGLYNKYNSTLSYCKGGEITGQDIIATRAHLSIHREKSVLIQQANDNFGKLTELMKMGWIRNAIANTKIPIPLILHGHTDGYQHAVVAYDMNELHTVYIYDPNAPGENRAIIFNNDNHEFESYRGYEYVTPIGTGSFYKEPFNNIYKDAENGFSSPDATIEITSPTSGETVQDRHQTISGRIISGEAIVEQLEVDINGDTYTTNVDSFGNFSLNVTLDPGKNIPKFTTKAYDSINQLVIVSNNLQCEQFNLTAPNDNAVILVTLTWSKNDTDLDLYAIDPNGDYSVYYHPETSDGAEIDYDDTDGYGPEHWTLQYSDTVQWNQDYKIRVHYFSDHDNGGTNYQVTVKGYEGTNREFLQTFSGYLGNSNPNNDAPTDSGADWADIVTIRPVQDTNTAGIQKVSVSKEGNIPVITVPVPTPEKRLNIKKMNMQNQKK